MTIKRGGIGAILFGKTEHEIEYCQHCLDVANIRVKLGKRIYFPDEFGNITIPPDDDNWRQCYECGRIFPIYELKKESVLEDFAEALDNPFEFGKSKIVGVGESRKFIRIYWIQKWENAI